MDVDYRAFAHGQIDKGYDMVVMGHTHWPALEVYRGGYYVNPGFWGRDFTFALLDAGVPAILQWDGSRAFSYKVELPPGNGRT